MPGQFSILKRKIIGPCIVAITGKKLGFPGILNNPKSAGHIGNAFPFHFLQKPHEMLV